MKKRFSTAVVSPEFFCMLGEMPAHKRRKSRCSSQTIKLVFLSLAGHEGQRASMTDHSFRLIHRFRQVRNSQEIYPMQSVEQTLEEELQLDDWFEAPTHDAAVEMMKADAVVAFGTAMWPF
jgi:hypothetical protein